MSRVSVAWELERSVDVTKFEELMRTAVDTRVVRDWDDGRGRWMWYSAQRGPAEQALRAKCVETLGARPASVSIT